MQNLFNSKTNTILLVYFKNGNNNNNKLNAKQVVQIKEWLTIKF